MSVSKKPATRTTRTRSEVASELSATKQAVASRPQVDDATKMSQAAALERAKVATVGITVENAAQALLKARLQTADTFLALEKSVEGEVKLLEDLTLAVEEKKRELQDLHGIDVTATSLNLALMDHDTKVAALAANYTQLSKELEQAHENKKKDLEAKIAEQKLTNERNQTQFIYDRDLDRQREKDEHEEAMRVQVRANRLKQETLEEGWVKRSEALNEREDALKKSEDRLAGIDEEIRKAVSKAEAIAIASTTRDLTHKFELERQGLNTKLALAEQAIKIANQQIEVGNANIASLQKQLEAAQERAAGIAEKALDSAAEKKAFADFSALQTNSNGTGVSKRPG